MTAALERAEVDRFRMVIAGRLGLQFDDAKLEFLADVLRQRLQAGGGTSAAYLGTLASNSREELRLLASHLTVSETYFLRNPDHFRALAELALPERMNVRSRSRKLRLLSAGCASGEEAYSISIILRDRFPEVAQWDARIRGIDVNPAMIEKAVRASYSPWSLRETPAEIRNRYFRKENSTFVLDKTVREIVSFEERNLAEEDPEFWKKEEFDVIFCRNVIMYLVSDLMQRVVERLTRALAPGGFLFLGHAETLRGLSHDFHLRHTHDTFYYQKREDAETRPVMSQPPNRPAPPAYQGIPWPDGSWVDVIRTASERIQNLADDCGKQSNPHRSKRRPANPSKSSTNRHPPVELGLALELLRQEKFREALEILHKLPPESTSDADTRLLRAVLLTNCGEVSAAEAVCAQLLAADDLNANAHYLMALCREHAGDRRGAMEQDRLAIHLDPAFAISHLHLGLLAQRSGDLATARHQLQQAVVLLLREDASRILLLGGGFSREALLEFSRAQLRSCGGLS
ncbi:MAG TPA: CheR family methyltransferase [Bryobacteraceae bacterium]|nr:CheR family methyltransferase [Bryobacteraceae bacterium]